MIRSGGIVILAAVMLTPATAPAVELKLFGSISGVVCNSAGVAQMGANVFLLNRYERVVSRVFTGPDGRFRFESLSPDSYSVRVSLNSYVPAARDRVAVRAGMESFLAIHLATLFSSIELVYTSPGQTGILSDDWKWVLRSSTATRPVLRALPQTQQTVARARAASQTRGLVKVSAGSDGGAGALGPEPDLGTAFALATSLFGSNELRVSGNLGYASGPGAPTAGFRTLLASTNENALSPNVELTVRQATIRQRAADAITTGAGSYSEAPVLRTLSLKLGKSTRVTDALLLEYGVMLESVAFLSHLNVLSPYGRMSYDMGDLGVVELGFASGAPPSELLERGPSVSPTDRMQQALTGLAALPRVSLRDGRARVQRTETYEVGYRNTVGSRTYAGAFYQDMVRDGTVTVTAPLSFFATSDLLPDFASTSSVFNAGGYRTFGYSGSMTQNLGSDWSATVSAGEAGMLAGAPLDVAQPAAATLRDSLRPRLDPWVATRLAGLLRGSGTRIVASYMWTPGGSLGPAHAYLTQRLQPQVGLNFQIRQPLPAIAGMPGRMELTAELRNLLAAGYIPLASPDGTMLYLVQFPRAVRGGVSFIF